MHDYLKELLEGYTDANTTGNVFPFRSVPKSDIKRLLEMKREGMTHKEIGDTLGITAEYVGMIINGHRRIDDVCEILSTWQHQ